jgi:hypothetical protein
MHRGHWAGDCLQVSSRPRRAASSFLAGSPDGAQIIGWSPTSNRSIHVAIHAIEPTRQPPLGYRVRRNARSPWGPITTDRHARHIPATAGCRPAGIALPRPGGASISRTGTDRDDRPCVQRSVDSSVESARPPRPPERERSASASQRHVRCRRAPDPRRRTRRRLTNRPSSAFTERRSRAGRHSSAQSSDAASLGAPSSLS